MNATAATMQQDLFTEAAPAPATAIERDVTTATDNAPVLYRCRACERRTGHAHLWRRTLKRTTTHTSYWHPTVARQVRFADITWTPTDGRTHRGEHPPADACPTSSGPWGLSASGA